MRLDQLQIALRPRAHAQALDLGFALLRAHAGPVYRAWLALWLPLMAIGAALACWHIPYGSWWLLAVWWLRPLLERAPLYVLSRLVFGETVGWRDAVRAWPGQLGGGWLPMLTWWRPWMPGRGLYQPVWQLEQARGELAAERRRAIGRNGTGRAAAMFGLACALFEWVLQLGLGAFISFFASDQAGIYPLAFLFNPQLDIHVQGLLMVLCYSVGGAVIAPFYCACCFTLYLNRRATLEAWDLEIALRQIAPPAPAGRTRMAAALLPMVVPALLAALLAAAPAPAAQAAPGAPATTTLPATTVPAAPVPAAPSAASSAASCAPPHASDVHGAREAARDAGQAAVRDQVDQLYATPALRGYVCEPVWRRKNVSRRQAPVQAASLPDLSWLATLLKATLIGGAACLAGWLLYRYRDRWPGFTAQDQPKLATTIAGLDIRAESLPGDVAANVLQLWRDGRQRAALALLYRATLSRLVQQDGLALTDGATEGECLRLARQAEQQGALTARRCAVAADVTALWLNGAYGRRWPDDATLHASCAAWQAQFDARTVAA